MIKSVLDYLDQTEARFGDKLAYCDDKREVTFTELKEDAMRIGSALAGTVVRNQAVLVYMAKSVDCIEAFLGVRYAGAFYVPIDVDMPAERVMHILETSGAGFVVTRHEDQLPAEIGEKCQVFYLDDILKGEEPLQTELLARIRRSGIDLDPIYAIFTSGSTGIPKGVLISERSAINFTDWYSETFAFDENEVFANQTPFFFDASVKDIYSTLKCGATMYIVPHKLFLLPAKLVAFLNDHKVTTIDWVPSVLCMIVNFKTFKKVKPLNLKKVMFLGEVMPTKQFNMWRQELPDIQYANLYGPTEATGDCTYYKVNREFADDESIPIGNACENTEVFLLAEDGRKIPEEEEGTIGEICVRGCSLALGYYNNPDKTGEVFTRDPFESAYEGRIYHTGDLGRYNQYGEILFSARKDAQIKHMGHRIELGEIETALTAVDGIERGCCLYDGSTDHIIAVYQGSPDKKEIIAHMQQKIPQYMIPNEFHQVEEMPINLNGKIDRVMLKNQYISK